MLTRQKTVLALLSQAGKPLRPMVFVKLVFLLRHETNLRNEDSFYDFVPYKYGPFSFGLYRELANLRRDGYVTPDEEHVALCEHTADLCRKKRKELSAAYHDAVDKIVSCYGQRSQSSLMEDLYSRYPWYATKSELSHLRRTSALPSKKERPAVNTAGYQGESVDAFFDRLLRRGIRMIIDVRANAASRRYGFSKRQFSEIGKRLGLGYRHMPHLGIPRHYRATLTDHDSYQLLLSKYEHEMLPRFPDEIDEICNIIQAKPAVLVCFERDVRCCHRSRLAEVVSRKTGLEIEHL